jgi:hypothetical protein
MQPDLTLKNSDLRVAVARNIGTAFEENKENKENNGKENPCG